MEIPHSPFGPAEIILILIAVSGIAIFFVLPFWFICKKAGFSPWLSLVVLLPFGLIILPFIMAFYPWKIHSNNKTEHGSETDSE